MDNPSAPAPVPPGGQMLIYRDGATRLQVRLDGQTVWLTQAAMAELFQTTKQNISLHLQNILDEKELQPDAVVKEYLTTAADGKRYRMRHYSLDAISHELAEEHAHAQYALHEQERRRLEAEQPTSDFDRAVKELTQEQREAKTPKRPTKPRRKKRTEGEE